ncbi:MAG: aromatase/cyclase [Actinocatenispora sp.]
MSDKHETTHQIHIDADPNLVYGIIADAASWPHRFAPTIHVEQTSTGAGTERLQIWAMANEQVKTWTSRRELDPQARRVTFRQEVSSPPVASMSGTWTAASSPGGGTDLVLTHEFTAVDDDPDNVAWITKATNSNSETELTNIRNLADGWDQNNELTFSFEDSIEIAGPLEEAYDFLYDAGQWPARLPHVGALELNEDVRNIQWMSMDTRTKDGSTHNTRSVRICFPGEKIVYKQLVTPSMMTVHVGTWAFERLGDGVRVTSHHTVTLYEPAIRTVLGESGTVESAKTFIRNAAGGNSAATLKLTKEYVEARRV